MALLRRFFRMAIVNIAQRAPNMAITLLKNMVS